jgi:hypothetical protein
MSPCRMPCCQPYRWHIVDVPGDGNCFFSAVAGAVGAAALRARVCDAAGLPADHAMRKDGEWYDTAIVPLETVAKVLDGPLAVRNQVEDAWQVVYPNGDIKFECIPEDACIIVAGGWHFMRVEATVDPEEPPPAYEDASKTRGSVMPMPVPAQVPRPPKRMAIAPPAITPMQYALFFIVVIVFITQCVKRQNKAPGHRTRQLARQLYFF